MINDIDARWEIIVYKIVLEWKIYHILLTDEDTAEDQNTEE